MMAWVARPLGVLQDGDAKSGGFARAGAGLAQKSTPARARGISKA